MDKTVDDVSPTSSASQEDNEPVLRASRIGTSDVQYQIQTSSQGASCIDGTEHSGELEGNMTANGSLMEAEGPLLTSPVQGLHSYSGPSNGASTSSANAGGSACILNRDYGTDSAEPMDNSLLALEHAQQVKETYAIVNITRRKKEEQEQLARKIERKEREIREKREQKGREQEEASRWPQQQEAFMENQLKEGDLLKDQGALQTESTEDAVPSNNESDPQSESTCNEEDLSATVSDDAVLGLMAAAAPECQMQIDHLENAVQERKKERNKTLQALLEKVSSRDDMVDLPGMHAVCDDSSTRLSVPAYRHSNTGVVTHVPLEPSLVDEVQGIDAIFLARHSQDPVLCESPQANVPEARPNMVSFSERSLVNEVQGIDAIFLARHSRDPDLCESLQANLETTSLLEAGPNMVSFSEPSLVNEVQGIDAIFLARHSRDPDLCESPQANLETTSLLEAGPNMFSTFEDSDFRQGIQNSCLVPSENDCVCCKNDGSQACSRVYGPIMPERCRPDSGHSNCCECLEVSSSEDPVSRQWIRNTCLVPSENDCVCCENDGSQACSRAYGPIMPERCQPDSGHSDCCECLEVSSSEDPVSRQWIRNACLVPSENDCVCCENDGSQACGIYGTIMPERYQPDSGHDESCICLEDVFSRSLMLPCSHHIYLECIAGMIPLNGQLNCPICGRPFLWRD